MKTAAMAATVMLALLVVGTATTIYAQHASSTPVTQSTSTSSPGKDNGHAQGGPHSGKGNRENNRLNLTVGKTITLTGLTGRYLSATNSSIRGKASANLTLQVSQVYREGFVLAISSGTLSVAGVNYGVTGGALQLGPLGQTGSGTGTTSSSGQFLAQVGIHGTSTSGPNARVVLDLKVGGSEYLVSLGTLRTGNGGSSDR